MTVITGGLHPAYELVRSDEQKSAPEAAKSTEKTDFSIKSTGEQISLSGSQERGEDDSRKRVSKEKKGGG